MIQNDILVRRLANQRLTSSKFTSVSEAVSKFGAMQAQELPGVAWALSLRVAQGTQATIERALNEGHILRTHCMRPTWHFVVPEDLAWIQELTAPNVKRAVGSYTRKHGLDEALFEKTNQIIVHALEDHGMLTRQELKLHLAEAGVETDTFRLAMIVMNAELDNLVTSGPMKGKQITYMLVKDRVVKSNQLTREQALAELAKRYFTTHGPAQLRDFAWWSGLSMTDVRQAQLLLETELKSFSVGSKAYWYIPLDIQPITKAPRAFLLSSLDEYIISYKDRSDMSRTQGEAMMFGELYTWVVILDGLVVGSWKRTLNKASVHLEFTLMHELSDDDIHAIHSAATQYATFLGRAAEISFTERWHLRR